MAFRGAVFAAKRACEQPIRLRFASEQVFDHFRPEAEHVERVVHARFVRERAGCRGFEEQIGAGVFAGAA